MTHAVLAVLLIAGLIVSAVVGPRVLRAASPLLARAPRLTVVLIAIGILSTPTGSTAYNKYVKGAVIDPRLPSFQVTELASVNNNRYRTLGTSFILSNERKLTLNIQQEGNEFPAIAADNEALGIKQVETVETRLSDKVIRTAKLADNSFFEKVQRTFF